MKLVQPVLLAVIVVLLVAILARQDPTQPTRSSTQSYSQPHYFGSKSKDLCFDGNYDNDPAYCAKPKR